MKRTFRLSLLLGLIFLIGSMAHADFKLTDWPHFKEIGPLNKEGYIEVTIDKEVYKQTMDKLEDLRIIDEKKNEIPFKLLVERSSTKETAYSPKLFNLSFIPGSHSLFMLDLGEQGFFNNRLTIDTSSTNFSRKVEIEGSDDRKVWYKVKSEGYIFDVSEEYKTRHTTLNYPENRYRYLKVIIWDYNEKPLKITGAQLYRRVVKKAKEVLLTTKIIERKEDPELKATQLYLDFGSKGQPSHRIEIISPDKNYHRRIEIAGSNDREEWFSLGSGYIFNYDTEKFKAKDIDTNYQEGQYQFLRITIFNYDNRPIDINNIKAYGIPRRIFYHYDPTHRYFLYYGNQEAKAPRYDIEQLLPHLTTKGLAVLTLGKEEKNPNYIPRRGPWTEEKPYLLWGIIIIAILVLACLILKLSKQVKGKSVQ